MNPWNFLFPFQKQMKNFTPPSNMKDMESYMKQMLSNIPMDGLQNQNNPFTFDLKNHSSSQPNIFETHQHVFIRIPIKNPDLLKKMKIFHTSNTLIIEGLSKDEPKQTFTLPTLVKKKGATAFYKDYTLEVTLEKAKDLQYSEIHINQMP